MHSLFLGEFWSTLEHKIITTWNGHYIKWLYNPTLVNGEFSALYLHCFSLPPLPQNATDSDKQLHSQPITAPDTTKEDQNTEQIQNEADKKEEVTTKNIPETDSRTETSKEPVPTIRVPPEINKPPPRAAMVTAMETDSNKTRPVPTRLATGDFENKQDDNRIDTTTTTLSKKEKENNAKNNNGDQTVTETTKIPTRENVLSEKNNTTGEHVLTEKEILKEQAGNKADTILGKRDYTSRISEEKKDDKTTEVMYSYALLSELFLFSMIELF